MISVALQMWRDIDCVKARITDVTSSSSRAPIDIDCIMPSDVREVEVKLKKVKKPRYVPRYEKV